jgi:transposase-like protein
MALTPVRTPPHFRAPETMGRQVVRHSRLSQELTVGVCRVHFVRNLLALVPKSHKKMVAAVFRTIFAQPNHDAVAQTLGWRP